MNYTKIIAAKELKSYFTSPAAYILLSIFLLIAGWFFANPLFLINFIASNLNATVEKKQAILEINDIKVVVDIVNNGDLKKIVDDLGLPLKKFVSEPVSAGAYFLHNYQILKQLEEQQLVKALAIVEVFQHNVPAKFQ